MTNGGHAVDGGSRLLEVRGDGCRGASWSEQLNDKELRGEDSDFMGTVFMASPLFFNYYIVVY